MPFSTRHFSIFIVKYGMPVKRGLRSKRGYSSVRLEQARLVSCLFYGTRFLIAKCTSGGFSARKGLSLCSILDDASNSDKSKLPRVRKTNLLNVKSSKISLNKTSKTLCNGIWQKQLLILKFEKGFFVNQYFLDYKIWIKSVINVKWKSKFEAVKINSKLDKVDKK